MRRLPVRRLRIFPTTMGPKATSFSSSRSRDSLPSSPLSPFVSSRSWMHRMSAWENYHPVMPGNFSRFFKNSFPRDDDAAVGMASAEKRRSRWESDSPFSLPSFYVFASTFCEQKRRDRSVPSLVVFSYFHASLERVNRMPPDGLLDLFQQRYFLFFFFFFFFPLILGFLRFFCLTSRAKVGRVSIPIVPCDRHIRLMPSTGRPVRRYTQLADGDTLLQSSATAIARFLEMLLLWDEKWEWSC